MSGVKLREGWDNLTLSQFSSSFKRCTPTNVPDIWVYCTKRHTKLQSYSINIYLKKKKYQKAPNLNCTLNWLFILQALKYYTIDKPMLYPIKNAI